MFLRLIGVYLICVIPVCIWNTVIPENQLKNTVNQVWGILIYCLYWLQYALNHFIYFYASPRYGKAFKQLWCKLTCQTVEPRHHRGFRRIRAPNRIYIISQHVPVANVDSSGTTSCIEYRPFSAIDISTNESLVTLRRLFEQDQEHHTSSFTDDSCSILSSSILRSFSDQIPRVRTISEASDWSFSVMRRESKTFTDGTEQIVFPRRTRKTSSMILTEPHLDKIRKNSI